MKTKRMLLSGLVFALLCSTSVFASEAGAAAKAQQDLKLQLQDEFKNIPFDDISALENCCVVRIKFTVTENNELEILSVDSKNKDLLRYAEVILKDNNIVASDILKGNKYIITLRFINEA